MIHIVDKHLNPQVLKPSQDNPRCHTSTDINAIVKSIKEFGFVNPIVIDEENNIIAGHGRLLAALSLDLPDVPVRVVSGLTPVQKKALMIADNRLAELSKWDRDLLANILKDITTLDDTYNLDIVGFTDGELNDLLSLVVSVGQGDPEAVPSIDDANIISQYGDIWVCGEHRVMCGDSTVWQDMEYLVGGEKLVHCVVTDPPYNVNYMGGNKKNKKRRKHQIINDALSSANFCNLLKLTYENLYKVLIDGGVCYIFYSNSQVVNFVQFFLLAGFHLASTLIWDKKSFVLSRGDYHYSYEPILYGWKPTGKHFFISDRTQGNFWESYPIDDSKIHIDEQEITFFVDDLIFKIAKNSVVEVQPRSILSYAKPLNSDLHPTMKPVALVERLIRNSTRRGDIVLDSFGGSGSTLIACECLGRVARVMELDPFYVDTIVRRWEEFTGRKAERYQRG